VLGIRLQTKLFGDRSRIGRSPNNPILPSTLSGRSLVTEAHLTGRRKEIFSCAAGWDREDEKEKPPYWATEGDEGRQNGKGTSTVWGPRHSETSTVWGPRTHTRTHTQTHAHRHTHTRAHTHTHTHTRTHARTHAQTHAQIMPVVTQTGLALLLRGR
jgi:hypothetical protein